MFGREAGMPFTRDL